jgi:hypothetical protein
MGRFGGCLVVGVGCLEVLERKFMVVSTDTTINFLSNHPPENKRAAYRFLISRMFTLPIPKEQRHEEWQNILHISPEA